MDLKDIFNKVKKEVQIIKGDKTRDTLFSSEQQYDDYAQAVVDYEKAKQKLFNIDGWSNLPGLSSTFELYDENGLRTMSDSPKEGYYVKIVLPGPVPENWVVMADITNEPFEAEITVFVSKDPQNPGNEIEHFFSRGASSTFRVELKNNVLRGLVIGKNEGVNNEGEDAGNRALINTVIAESGWAFFQQLQWDKLCSYFVHKEEEA
jgi:hypothetical protein